MYYKYYGIILYNKLSLKVHMEIATLQPLRYSVSLLTMNNEKDGAETYVMKNWQT